MCNPAGVLWDRLVSVVERDGETGREAKNLWEGVEPGCRCRLRCCKHGRFGDVNVHADSQTGKVEHPCADEGLDERDREVVDCTSTGGEMV